MEEVPTDREDREDQEVQVPLLHVNPIPVVQHVEVDKNQAVLETTANLKVQEDLAQIRLLILQEVNLGLQEVNPKQ